MSAAVSAFHRYRRRVAWRAVHRLWRTVQRAGAITPGTPGGQKFAAFGAGSIIGFPTGALYGERWIEIGAETMIGVQVSLSAGMVPGQDLGGIPLLRIGDRCLIGRGSHIVAHYSIVIGDDVYTGPYVYITDQNHGYADRTGRRVSVEYALIRDVNDQPWRADLLGSLLHHALGPLVHVNVIPLNPTPGSKWDASPKPVQEEFVRRVAAAGVPCTVRDTRGREIAAACGQLAAAGER